MNKTIIPIKGMHCRSCELLIEEKLNELPQVKKVKVSWKEKQAEVFSDQPLSSGLLEQAVIDAGYEVGKEEKQWISTDPNQWKDLIYAGIVLLVLYIIAKNVGLGNLNFASSGKPSSLLVVLIVGLTAGISTCMALVGGLILGISARHAEKHPEATPAQKFRPHLFFNIGRIGSYFILGGLIGLIGKAFQLSGTVLGALTIVVGLVMLTLGLQLIEVFPKLSSGGLTLPPSLAKLLGIKKHHDKEYSHGNSIIIGALTFFLPCGFTQAMQLYAMSTGNFWAGALIMGTFALGTAPGLLGVGGLTSLLKGAFAKKFFKFVGLLVVFLAIFNITNGFNLAGLSAKLSNLKSAQSASNTVKDDPNVKLENGVQIVRMTQNGSGYKPNKFTIKKGIPVKWIVNSTESGSCAASLYSQKLNIRKFLSAGENIIEFTPQETGQIAFSCSMGMYRGSFNVVENTNDNVQTFEAKPTETKPQDTNTAVKGDQDKAQPKTEPVAAKPQPEVQLIKARYVTTNENSTSDITPERFTVTAGKPVRFEVYPEIDGEGCMSSITIPGLVNDYNILEKGKTVVFEFTPQKKGEYSITCAMGVPRGSITVI